MSKATTLTQFELHALKSANYTDKKFSELSSNVVALFEELSLGIASDGLIYIFVNGSPVGSGIQQSAGVEGDVFGYVDENNTIVLNGKLADGTYKLKYEMENGTTVDIGNMVLDTNVYYSVTNNLTNCTINNSVKSVVEGGSYSAVISANDGFELKSVSVTMGGSPVTVSGGVINISNVTGNIIITAVAEEIVAAEPVTADITITDGIRIGSDGGDRTQAGYCATPHIDLTNIPKPCTIHLTKAKWLVSDGENNTMIRVYAKKADGTQLITDVAKEGIGGSYFTIVDNSDIGNDVIVTITSNDVGYIRFSGQWTFAGASDSQSSFVAANTKATLTYTPIEGGGSNEPTTQTYTITSNLTNCTINNSATAVDEGSAYNATITANSGYELKSVTVTIGGSAVSVSGGVINIASVTGDIVITAVAEEKAVEVEPTNFFKATPTVNTIATASQDAVVIGGRLGSDNGYRVDGGPDCMLTNYIPVANGDEVYVTNLTFSATLNSGMYKSDKTVIGGFKPDNTSYVTNVTTSGNVQSFKISNANAGYVRISGKPGVVKNASGSTVDTKYDLTQIIINVKRNGAWL